MSLRDRYGPWALISGGSEGVGASFARKLADAGLNLILVARKPAPLEALKTELGGKVQIRTLALDILSPNAVAKIADLAADVQVGLLICNAGSATGIGDFLDKPLAAAQDISRLNNDVPVALCHHFGGLMRKERRGGILLVSSMAGYAGNPGFIAYAGAKAYMRIFAEGLWYELKPYGVDVLCLSLSATDTPAMRREGMNADVPGFSLDDADSVAQQGLDHLADGPGHVVESAAAGLPFLTGPDRGQVVGGFAQASRALFAKN